VYNKFSEKQQGGACKTDLTCLVGLWLRTDQGTAIGPGTFEGDEDVANKGQMWIILELLEANGELCGVELADKNEALNGMGIYVVLGRMEKQGLIKARWEVRPGVAGRGVKLFQLKDAGRYRLRALRAEAAAMAGFEIAVAGRVI
jgi:Transcriptional regulator PadR-like family